MKTIILLLCFLILAGCQEAEIKTDAVPAVAVAEAREISPEEARPLVEVANAQFIDVRTPEEFASGRAKGVKNIPLDTVAANVDKLDKKRPVYIICRTGSRSRTAAKILSDAGFAQAIIIAGGTEAWLSAGLPME